MCKKYYKDGKLHRNGDKAAIIWYYISHKIEFEIYYKDGKLHRDQDKAVIIKYSGIKLREKIEFEIYYKDGIMKKIDNNSFFPFNIWKYFE